MLWVIAIIQYFSDIEKFNTILSIADNAKDTAYQNRKRCCFVAADVQNAFISVPWLDIIEALKSKNSPE